jgi:hypothetical protein
MKQAKQKQSLLVVNMTGWYGVLAILGAYMLVSFSVISAHSLAYQLINLSGALGLIIEAGTKRDVQPVALNVVWSAIAVVAIINIVR